MITRWVGVRVRVRYLEFGKEFFEKHHLTTGSHECALNWVGVGIFAISRRSQLLKFSIFHTIDEVWVIVQRRVSGT
jgi:hypothetical protein